MGKGSAISAAFLVLLAACAPRNNLRQTPNTPEAARISSVPFFSNTSDQCGPASLASVLNYWGKKTSPEELRKEIYVPSIAGTLPMDMRPALDRRGLSGMVIRGSFEQMKAEILQERPVIAYLNFGTKKNPIGHFLVITGYDDRRQGVIVHSGPAKDKFASYRRFDRGWKDTDRWMLIARPTISTDTPHPVSLPPSVLMQDPITAQDRVQLGNLYETQGLKTEAVAQYRKALEINPHFETALMSLGNISFESGDYVQAQKYYRRVLQKNPTHGGANNNLAMVYLMEGKKLQRAEALAKRAIATDVHAYACDTLGQIYAKQNYDPKHALEFCK